MWRWPIQTELASFRMPSSRLSMLMLNVALPYYLWRILAKPCIRLRQTIQWRIKRKIILPARESIVAGNTNFRGVRRKSKADRPNADTWLSTGSRNDAMTIA